MGRWYDDLAAVEYQELIKLLDGCLDYRTRRIILLNADGLTFEEIGKKCGLTRARVGQIINEGRHVFGRMIREEYADTIVYKEYGTKPRNNHNKW